MSAYDILKEPEEAKKYLSKRINDGSLILFLGAGVSRGFGLPNWLDLVNSMLSIHGFPEVDKAATADDLMGAVNDLESKLNDQSALISLVQETLYRSVKIDDVGSLSHTLLVAVSALMMGSKRGHVSRVVTLNYDNMLEWFLSVFGFVVRTVYKLPEIEGSEDVRIYHPNGFIPHPKSNLRSSSSIILSRTSVNLRNGASYDAWKERTKQILTSGTTLFLGLSHNSLIDRANEGIFSNVARDISSERTTGIWISYDPIDDKQLRDFSSNNIVPIHIGSVDGICKFLLDVCQMASKNVS